MAEVRFVAEHAGIDELAKSPQLAAVLRARAEAAAAAARSTAPVDTGRYRDSIRVEVVEHPTRMVARVVSDVPYAMVIAARDGNLQRALDAAR